MDIINWFNKRRIITILAALLAFIVFLSIVSIIVGKQKDKKFSEFSNDDFSIEQLNDYKSAVFGEYKIVLSESGDSEPEGESISISRNDGKYSKASIKQLQENTTTKFIDGEPIESIEAIQTNIGGNPALIIDNSEPKGETYSRTAYIYIGEYNWQVEIAHKKDSLLAKNTDRIFNSLEPKD